MGAGAADRDRELRIGIIGAGAAGLSLAAYLGDEGYRRVTILEREAFSGGKCRSWRKGGKAWELGAVMATTDYEATLGMMERTGIGRWRPRRPALPTDRSFVPQGLYPIGALFPGWFGLLEAGEALRQVAKFHVMSGRWKAAFAPGNLDIGGELARPYSEWVRRHGMEKLAKLCAIPFTSFGYGYYDEVPAAYVLKYFEPGITRAFFLQNKFFYWEEGVQAIWERLAAGMDVRYGVDIRELRRGEKARLRLADGSELEFDRIVICSPLDEALDYLDADEEERELFGRIRHTDYRVYICRSRGSRVPGGFAPGRFRREGAGKPLIWDLRHRDENLYTYYILGTGSESEVDMESAIAEDLRLVGGSYEGAEARARWKYFPHVGSEDIEAGYYRRLEALQGRRSTYYAGELLSFSTVERTIRYSRDLARRFFAGAGP